MRQPASAVYCIIRAIQQVLLLRLDLEPRDHFFILDVDDVDLVLPRGLHLVRKEVLLGLGHRDDIVRIVITSVVPAHFDLRAQDLVVEATHKTC